MNKNLLLKILNPALAFVFLSQVTTAMLHGILPKPLFEPVHAGGGLILAFGVLVHVLLNWGWVKAHFFSKPR